MIIYKILDHLNNKKYIGLTTLTLKRRWQYHLSASRVANPTKVRPIDKAIAKYGEENFSIKVVEKIPEKKGLDFLGGREIFWINKYNTTNSDIGYNKATGGELNIGRIVSEETKLKLRQNPRRKQIFSYDLKGNLLKSHSSINEASRELNIQRANIGKALNKNKKAGNKIFKTFLNKTPDKKVDVSWLKDRNYRQIKIYQFDKNLKIINLFNSIREASRKTGFTALPIQNCNSGKAVTAHGYYWSANKNFKPRKPIKNKGSKKVKINVYDYKGTFIKTFSTIKEASKEININEWTISLNINRKTKANHVYTFKNRNSPKKYLQVRKYRGNTDNIGPIKTSEIGVLNAKKKLIKKYGAIISASKDLKIPHQTIRHGLIRRNLVHNKYYFVHLNKNQHLKKFTKPIRIKIKQHDLEGNFIKEYESIQEASRKTGIASMGIGKCVRKTLYSSGGFRWFKKTN